MYNNKKSRGGTRMNIKLPKEFQMKSRKGIKVAYIENGILKVKRNCPWRKVMTEVTYEIYGKTTCYYCRQKVSQDKITIDHIYPQDFGGPTISNNMLPSCSKCNVQKGNLDIRQYRKYLEAKKEGNLKVYKEKIVKRQRKMRKNGIFGIPKSWISEKNVADIIVVFNLGEEYKKYKYQRIAKYYEQYKYFQKPILVDKNGFLLDGFLTLLYAKNNQLKIVPTIQLDNVEVIL